MQNIHLYILHELKLFKSLSKCFLILYIILIISKCLKEDINGNQEIIQWISFLPCMTDLNLKSGFDI